jgi:hypothetical protein
MAQLTTNDASNAPVASGRILACGLRGFYTGIQENIGGVALVHTSPRHNNQSFNNNPFGLATTWSSLLAYDDVDVIESFNKSDVLFVDHPVSTEEREFRSGDATQIDLVYPWAGNENNIAGFQDNNAAVQVGAPCVIIAIQGEAGKNYMFEYIQHSEYAVETGTSNGGLTKTEVDANGQEMLLNSITTMKGKHKPRDRWRALRNGLKEALRTAAGIAIPATEQALSAALMAA